MSSQVTSKWKHRGLKIFYLFTCCLSVTYQSSPGRDSSKTHLDPHLGSGEKSASEVKKISYLLEVACIRMSQDICVGRNVFI